MLDNDPCVISENTMVKPGKGQAFNRVKLRNLKTNRIWERTFKSGESLEAADVMELTASYLYRDGDDFHFMNEESFEQYVTSKAVVADAEKWIAPSDKCQVTLWNGEIITVLPPQMKVVRIAETDPGLRGDTATGGSKPATLETGATVQVPLFVDQGEFIKVDTREGKYLSRAKDASG